MTSINSVSGIGKENLSEQIATTLSESESISTSRNAKSDGSEIKTAGGIKPETSPKDYADGSPGTAAKGGTETKTSGFEELNNHDAESAKKENNATKEKVLKHMEQIYLGQETSPESLGETVG